MGDETPTWNSVMLVGPGYYVLVERTPTVLEQISALLPDDFPIAVAEPVINGLEKAARQLSMP